MIFRINAVVSTAARWASHLTTLVETRLGEDHSLFSERGVSAVRFVAATLTDSETLDGKTARQNLAVGHI